MARGGGKVRRVELLCFVRFRPEAFGLQAVEFGEIFFKVTAQTCFLEREVGELLLEVKIGVRLDQSGARTGFVASEEIRKLNAAEGVDAGFERRNTIQTSARVGEGLDELGFTVTDGLVFGGEA